MIPEIIPSVSTKQRWIAELSERHPERRFISLAHYIDEEWMMIAYRRTRKDGAVGIDGQTAKEYEQDLIGNLRRLLGRFKSGTYRAPPVRRKHIPKGNTGSETRPIGIPCFEDKVLQRAVAMVLEPIYEKDFKDFSYGFRPKRSAHQALQFLWQSIMTMYGGWVLDVDVRKYFDTLDHIWLRRLLERRVGDGVIRRQLHKWLKAGVWENGQIEYSDHGTPQGGVISPIISNIYLHEVLDTWFEEIVRPRMKGSVSLIRFADDFVMIFSDRDDALRVHRVLPKRFGKHGLTIHPEKTRLVAFRSPRGNNKDKPGTFDFLGFTHYWGKSRRGKWVVQRKTAKDRLARAISSVSRWCRSNRHKPIRDQHRTLIRKILGHLNYYGITGNSRSLRRFVRAVTRQWQYWLNRRRRERDMSWPRFLRLLNHLPLPRARTIHSVVCRA